MRLGLGYEDGKFKGVGTPEEFDNFEKVLIEFCERKNLKPFIPNFKLIIKPKVREIITVGRSKTS